MRLKDPVNISCIRVAMRLRDRSIARELNLLRLFVSGERDRARVADSFSSLLPSPPRREERRRREGIGTREIFANSDGIASGFFKFVSP